MTQTDKQSVMDRLNGARQVPPTLGDVLRDVSNLDTQSDPGREVIEYIDIGLIDSDPNNFYALTQLDELAANIETVGLQQPLRVRSSDTDPRRVMIVSGHRRRAALAQLVADGREDLRAVPCIREHAAGSTALQELRMIYANSGTRVLTSAELSKQAARVEELLYLLKEEGIEFPGRMRDHVAQACKVSAPKLARLKVIREKLIPEYMAMFEKDKLPEQTAYALARMPEDFQCRMFTALQTTIPSGATAEKVLGKYNEGWRWDPQLTCPDGKACKRGDAFLRRDCETSYIDDLCGGYTCCLECPKAKETYIPCARMCSRAKQERKEAASKKKEAEHERKQENGRKYQEETQGYAKRLLRAIDAAGVPEYTKIYWSLSDVVSVSEVRQWAAGEFDDPAGWTEPHLHPLRCYGKNLTDTSELLDCSVDFLLGKTEELRPAPAQEESGDILKWKIISPKTFEDYTEALKRLDAPEVPLPGSGEICEVDAPEWPEGQLMICGWMPGGTFPSEPCEVVADFDVGGGAIIREVCHYVDGHFSFRINSGAIGARIDAEAVRWIRLPPVE